MYDKSWWQSLDIHPHGKLLGIQRVSNLSTGNQRISTRYTQEWNDTNRKVRDFWGTNQTKDGYQSPRIKHFSWFIGALSLSRKPCFQYGIATDVLLLTSLHVSTLSHTLSPSSTVSTHDPPLPSISNKRQLLTLNQIFENSEASSTTNPRNEGRDEEEKRQRARAIQNVTTHSITVVQGNSFLIAFVTSRVCPYCGCSEAQ